MSWREDSLVGPTVPVALSRSFSRCLYHLPSLRHGKALLFLHRLHPRIGLVLWVSQSERGIDHSTWILLLIPFCQNKNVALTWMTGPIFMPLAQNHHGHEVVCTPGVLQFLLQIHHQYRGLCGNIVQEQLSS